MPKLPGVERRKFPRKSGVIGASITAINNQLLPFKYDSEIGHNISEGGICLELTKPLSLGDKINLEILLAENSYLFTASGNVVWIDSYRREEVTIDGIRIPAKDNYKAGIEFINISKENRCIIKEYVAD